MDDSSRESSSQAGRKEESEIFVFSPYHLDAINEQLWHGNRLIPLTPKPFALLRYLLQRPKQLLKKEELLTRLWSDTHVSEGVLKTCLNEIRQALGDSAKSPRFIETAHGRGYRFIAEVQRNRDVTLMRAPIGVRYLPQSSSATSPPSRFVGRNSDVDLLGRALEKASAGARQVIFVTGEAGIGKTVLVETFLSQLPPRDDLWLAWGQCIDQYGAGEAYLPMLEALHRACRMPRGERLVETLRSHAPTWLAQMPALAESL